VLFFFFFIVYCSSGVLILNLSSGFEHFFFFFFFFFFLGGCVISPLAPFFYLWNTAVIIPLCTWFSCSLTYLVAYSTISFSAYSLVIQTFFGLAFGVWVTMDGCTFFKLGQIIFFRKGPARRPFLVLRPGTTIASALEARLPPLLVHPNNAIPKRHFFGVLLSLWGGGAGCEAGWGGSLCVIWQTPLTSTAALLRRKGGGGGEGLRFPLSYHITVWNGGGGGPGGLRVRARVCGCAPFFIYIFFLFFLGRLLVSSVPVRWYLYLRTELFLERGKGAGGGCWCLTVAGLGGCDGRSTICIREAAGGERKAD
jgi:hypothetical protein